MSHDYIPRSAPEASIYDGLWKVASNGVLELSGAQAVEFFRKSGVDLGILKQIWGLSTPLATMNVSQFYTALRLITMVQNGDIPITKGKIYTIPFLDNLFSFRTFDICSKYKLWTILKLT